MILYTIVPVEVVMSEDESEEAPPVEMEWQGVRLLVTPLVGGRARIERVLSTDPADFLRPELQPGAILAGP